MMTCSNHRRRPLKYSEEPGQISRSSGSSAYLRAGVRRPSAPGGFTLVEVLATLLLMAIVLPAVMEGISLAGNLASNARRRTEASGLAESKLNEIVSTNLWQGQTSLAGDFQPDSPDYTWTATIAPWAQDTTTQSIQQVDVTVSWQGRGHQESLTLSTLTYTRGTSSGTGSSS